MHEFELKILTPETKLFSGKVASLTLPTEAGIITVLRNHTPIISSVSIGEVKIKENNQEKTFHIQGGVLDVKQDGSVFLLADTEIKNFEKTESELEEAIKKANESMKVKLSEEEFAHFESEIERDLYLMKYLKKGK